MKIVIKLLKGICIGVANVIPGFSGATMAIIVNIYDEFVSAMADIFQHPIMIIKKSWSLFVGVFVGILLALFSVVKLLEVAPLITILFFVGLIVGSIPSHYKNQVDLKPIKMSYIITFLLTILVIVGLPLFNENVITDIEMNFITMLILFIMGVISASAMVIPGVSGSMVLMIFGYYAYVTGSIKEFIELVVKFDFSNIWSLFSVLVSFGIGILLGVVLISKLIRVLYNKWANLFNIAVLGLLLASPFAILYASNSSYVNMFDVKWYTWLVGVLFLILGAAFSHFTTKLTKASE